MAHTKRRKRPRSSRRNRRRQTSIHDPLMQIVRDKASEILAFNEANDKSENTVIFIEKGTLKVLEP